VKPVALSTGVTLNVHDEGSGEPILFLHGFPESHRTFRHQLVDLARDHRVVAPDQRGFAGSSKPDAVADYATERVVADVFALADALGIGRFTLVGHDWGGAAAWAAALARPDRVARLVIMNAPHPLIFQRSLIEDAGQRAASQYITAFRNPGFEAFVAGIGLDGFFDKSFAPNVDMSKVTDADRAAYLAEWGQPGALTGMLNWYRAAQIVVPAPHEQAAMPDWVGRTFPPVRMPVLVIWGIRDTALLPVQLEGLDALVPDLTVTRVDAGHFVTWEAPEAVTAAIRAFLEARPA
jgi:pimeloyl-ACP methyl ester carboxylesterase